MHGQNGLLYHSRTGRPLMVQLPPIVICGTHSQHPSYGPYVTRVIEMPPFSILIMSGSVSSTFGSKSQLDTDSVSIPVSLCVRTTQQIGDGTPTVCHGMSANSLPAKSFKWEFLQRRSPRGMLCVFSRSTTTMRFVPRDLVMDSSLGILTGMFRLLSLHSTCSYR